MDAIFDHPPAERDALPRHRSAFSAWMFSITLLLLVGTGLPAEAGKPNGGGGGKPPGDSTQTLPIRLGLPAGCSSSEGYGLNNGTQANGQLVVVGQGFCSNATKPVRWKNGNWTDVFSYPVSGIATDASDASPNQADGETGVGFTAGNDYFEFVQSPHSVPLRLPRLQGTAAVICHKLRISSSGENITGCVNGADFDEVYGVRWNWDLGAGWVVESLGLSFYPRAISDDGSVIVGNVDEQVRLWLELTEGGGEIEPVGQGFAEDISFSPDKNATMVVGYREQPCTRSCNWYPVPVYWTETPSGWVPHDLSALDGVDSKALAVAEVAGQWVIVGYGFTRKDAIQRAVAWIPDANGNYGQPRRLDAIDGRSKSWARAVDINNNGVVLGSSAVGGWGQEAVLWILPN
jgi:hypothetical protein